jgi:capsular exopolysaccharide synthesis family protein
MSKFFNETQKANQWAQRKPSDSDMDVREMLESIKQGSIVETPTLNAPLTQYQQVHVGNGNGNATHIVLRQDQSSKEALEAYRALRTRLMRAQLKAGSKTIAITSSLPGEGKTLTTMNLGLCYAQLPQQRVLVIDGDLRTCGLTTLLDHPGTLGLAEVLAGKATLDEAIVATNQKNFFVLPAGTISSPPPELFSGSHWQEVLGRCSERFEVVLIDTPPIIPLADFELISVACQGVVVVVRAHYGQRETLQKSAGSVDRKKLLGFVFNGADANEKQYYGYKYEAKP